MGRADYAGAGIESTPAQLTQLCWALWCSAWCGGAVWVPAVLGVRCARDGVRLLGLLLARSVPRSRSGTLVRSISDWEAVSDICFWGMGIVSSVCVLEGGEMGDFSCEDAGAGGGFNQGSVKV